MDQAQVTLLDGGAVASEKALNAGAIARLRQRVRTCTPASRSRLPVPGSSTTITSSVAPIRTQRHMHSLQCECNSLLLFFVSVSRFLA